MGKDQAATFRIEAFDKTAKTLNKIDAQLSRFGKRVSGFGSKLSVGISAPLAAVGAASVKIGSDFEKGMREVNSLLNLPQQEFQKLKDETRKLGSALGTDLVASTGALYQAISAGVPKDNAIEFLKVASKAAIAGVTDTETAVDGLTTVLNAFKIPASEVERVADVMFTTVKGGKTTMDELSRSLFQVAPIASSMGVSLEEVSAATATLTKSGTPTSVAMTQIRQSMVALKKPNKEMADLLEQAGIKSVEASIAADGLQGTYEKLSKEAEGNQLASAVGSVEALQAVLGVTGENAKTFKADLDAMTDSAGAMNDAFLENDKGTSRSFAKLKSRLQAVAIVIEEKLSPFIQKAVEIIGRFADKISGADPALVGIGVAIAAVAAAIGPVLVAVGGLISAFGAIAGVLGTVSAAIAGVSFAPIILGVAAAIAVIAAAVTLITAHWDSIQAAIQAGIQYVVGAFNSWRERNSETIEKVAAAWTRFQEVAVRIFNAVSAIVAEKVAAIIAKLNEWLEPIGGLQGAWEILQKVIGEAIDFITRTVGTWIDLVVSNFEEIAAVLEGQKSAWEGFKAIVSNIAGAVGKIIGDLVDTMIQHFKDIDWGEVGAFIMEGLKDGIVKAAKRPINAVKGIADSLLKAIEKPLGINSPSRVFKEIGAFLMQGLAIGVDDESDQAVGAVDRVAKEVIDAASQIGGVGGSFSGIRSEMDETEDHWQGITDRMHDGLEQFIETGKFNFKGFASSILKDLTKVVSDGSFSSLFGGGGSGGGGGFLGSIGSAIGSLFSFDGGGFTGQGPRSGGVDGKGGFPAILHPNETVIDHSRGQGAGVVNITIQQTLHFKETISESDALEIGKRTKDSILSELRNINERGGKRRRAYGMA